MAECYGAGLVNFVIARSWVRLPPVAAVTAAVYQRQLSAPSLRGWIMSSSLRATGWRPSVADWGDGMSVVLHIAPQVPPLAHANQLPLPRLWSAAVLRVFSCKQRYIKYTDLYLLPLSITAVPMCLNFYFSARLAAVHVNSYYYQRSQCHILAWPGLRPAQMKRGQGWLSLGRMFEAWTSEAGGLKVANHPNHCHSCTNRTTGIRTACRIEHLPERVGMVHLPWCGYCIAAWRNLCDHFGFVYSRR